MSTTIKIGLSSLVLMLAVAGGCTSDKGGDRPAADNTRVNQRDRLDSERTADQQKNNETDLDLTQQIRKSVVGDGTLSTNAKNVKIIAEHGVVTLKGPVASPEEKLLVEQKAIAVAGEANVITELEVAP